MYYAIDFPEEVRNKLWKIYSTFFEMPGDGWVKYMDHITIIHSSHPCWETVSSILDNFEGHRLEFKIVGIGYSSCAIAFKVDTKTANEVSHITIAVKGGHFPKESNDITYWEKLYCDESFLGRLIRIEA